MFVNVQVCPTGIVLFKSVLFSGCFGAPFCPRRQLRSRSQPRSAQIALKTTSSHDDNSPWAGQARCLLLKVGLWQTEGREVQKVQKGAFFFRLNDINIPDTFHNMECAMLLGPLHEHHSWIEILEAFLNS